MTTQRKPIFYDEERRRWRFTRRVLELSGALVALLVLTFLVHVFRTPSLREVVIPETHPSLHAVKARARGKPPVLRQGRHRRIAALGNIPQQYDPLRAAFYVSWDANSFASLQQHYRDIDLLIPEELHAFSADGSLTPDVDARLESWRKTSQVELPVMPLVNNYDGSTWRIPEMAAMLANSAARRRLAGALTEFGASQHDPGIVVDFEEVPDSSQANFRKFAKELGATLHASGLKLMIALPTADWSYDYAFFSGQADAIILMNYDQHWPTSASGPIVAQEWYIRNLENILKIVPPAKLVMGIANYAYDWPEKVPGKARNQPRPVGQAISFQQAMITSMESEAPPEFDPDTMNPHFSYVEDNQTHSVWMLDAVTAYNELRAAERAAVRGTALWRLGSEDPSLWSIWDTIHPDDGARARLKEIPAGYDLILEGQGDIWKIVSTPESGQRDFRYDAGTDTISAESFPKYPQSYRIEQMGAVPKKVALTFDDGPDPRWTPRILDILKQKHAPAAFFVIGENADSAMNLVHREYLEGHEIGNHTYTHPELDQTSRGQLQLQLNLTERLIESKLGVQTLLFRPPYGIDHQPEFANEVALLPIPQQMGYLLIGARIDPHDWGEPNGGAPPPPQVIAERVLEQAEAYDKSLREKGNIILLHDGGGDRSHTLAALPLVIDRLRQAGFEFVSVSDLLGQTRAQVMPPLQQQEWLLARSDAFMFDLFNWLRLVIVFIFISGIGLVSGRALIIGLLALAEKMRPAPTENAEYQPLASVLIPAYNEEAAIVETVRSALSARYAPLEVIVVDDGSVDRTHELVCENFGTDPRVRLLRQPNRGKPAALNHGLAQAVGEIIVTIDADTTIDPLALANLVRHFANPRVAAVAGNVKVRNRNRWLTRWQALEYITSQNLEKRAFDLLNCIPVVPGAVGAWRASLLRDCGGFSGDTVAEDTDLTLTLRRAGWKILYDEEALAQTEVPETAEALIRQRFRWTFGTLQAVWKHADTVGRKRYGTLGWVAIPNIFLFQIFLPLVSPVIDLLFVASVALWGLAQLHLQNVPQLWTASDVERSLIFFALFMVIDLLTCVVAFALERHEDWSLLAPLLLQRFYYRQMMYVVLFRALKEAVQGRPVGWRGVEPQLRTPASA